MIINKLKSTLSQRLKEGNLKKHVSENNNL